MNPTLSLAEIDPDNEVLARLTLCLCAAVMFANGISRDSAVQESFRIFDEVVAHEQKRLRGE
jgi:hypothetical protein